jgi:hypothetical protein
MSNKNVTLVKSDENPFPPMGPLAGGNLLKSCWINSKALAERTNISRWEMVSKVATIFLVAKTLTRSVNDPSKSCKLTNDCLDQSDHRGTGHVSKSLPIFVKHLAAPYFEKTVISSMVAMSP